jgi:hypothetical protein
MISGKAKWFSHEAVAKASPNRAVESGVVDAKPCDLPMVRVKAQ